VSAESDIVADKFQYHQCELFINAQRSAMGKYGFWTFVSNQWRSVAPVLRKDLSGKTVVVVGMSLCYHVHPQILSTTTRSPGANTGIGFEAALHFGRMNPERLIIGCRNEDKGNTALSS